MSDLAAALDTAPVAVLEAIERNGITPLVDTAVPKRKTRDGEENGRPTNPEIRCLPFEVKDFRQLAAALGAREAMEADSVPAEIG